MYTVSGWPLCLHCFSKIQQMEAQQQADRMVMMNYLLDSIDQTTGIPSSARFRVPQPVINNRPVIQQKNMTNNIKIDNSVVGAVNTGTINSLNQSLNTVDPKLANALKLFSESVLVAAELDDKEKTAVLENAAFVTEQVGIPADTRKTSMIRNAYQAIRETVSVSASLTTIWRAIGPVLKAHGIDLGI